MNTVSQSISDVSVSLPPLEQIIAILTLQAGFNSAIVVAGTTFLGIAAGAVGTFALLRKRALMGDALAHSALPGLALAFIVGSLSGIGGKHLWLLLTGATISGVIGVICVQLLVRYSRLYEDAAIGAVLSVFFGAGVVLMSIIQSLGTGEEGGLHHFIFGQTAAMNSSDAYLTLAIAVLALFCCTMLFKESRLVCFDASFAVSTGWPVSVIDLLMMSLVVVVTVIGLQAVGLLLIIALLVVPAAGARFWSDRLHIILILSATIGGLSGYLGSTVSALLPRLPAGAVIVLMAGAIFVFSFLFAPVKGVIAVFWARAKKDFCIAEDHLLREIYELREIRKEDPLTPSNSIVLNDLKLCHSWSLFYRLLILSRMKRRNLAEFYNLKSVKLLEDGIRQSALRVRNHRLWEEYLMSFLDVPASHVDYSAEYVEHVLSPEIISELEESLLRKGYNLQSLTPLQSLHPIKGTA